MKHVRLPGDALLASMPVGGEMEGFLDWPEVLVRAEFPDARAQFGKQRIYRGGGRQSFVRNRHCYQFVAPGLLRASQGAPHTSGCCLLLPDCLPIETGIQFGPTPALLLWRNGGLTFGFLFLRLLFAGLVRTDVAIGTVKTQSSDAIRRGQNANSESEQ